MEPMPSGILTGGLLTGGILTGGLLTGGILPGGLLTGGILPGGLLPYMVFMGEICDRKVLHNVAHPRKLLFDPLFAKFVLK